MFDADEDLLQRAVAGDTDALGKLLTRQTAVLRAMLCSEIGRQWGPMLDAEDVLQVTFIEAFLGFDNFKPKGVSSFASWLKQIARRNVQDAIRGLNSAKRPNPRNQVRAPAGEGSVWELLDLAGGDLMTASRTMRREERRMILDNCLKRLPDDYATVVRMYELEEQSVDAVAEAIKKKPGAVYMIRARAIVRLREMLPGISVMMSRGK